MSQLIEARDAGTVSRLTGEVTKDHEVPASCTRVSLGVRIALQYVLFRKCRVGLLYYSVHCHVVLLRCSSVLVAMTRVDTVYLHIGLHGTIYNDTLVRRSQDVRQFVSWLPFPTKVFC